MRLSKHQVAIRQLDTAINLFFDGRDVVSVHTLASAASAVFADLVKASGQERWRDRIVASFPGQEDEVIRTLRRAENFFKHADRDHDDELEFDETTNDETIIVATLEYGELLRGTGRKVSGPMSVFQLWYFAKNPEALLMDPELGGADFVEKAQFCFPDLETLTRDQQLEAGSNVLERWMNHRGQLGS